MAIDIKAIISAVDQTGPAFKSAQKSMNDFSALARRATRLLAGVFSVREVAGSADAYAGLQARLNLASRSAEEFAAANEAVTRIAKASQAPLLETATLYTRIASSLKDTNVAQADFVSTTEAVALALRISGASTAEAQSGMLQFSQAIASGVLRGEEFNAISESAPRLLQALAVSLGKPVGELRAMAKEGQLTREVLIDGLANELPTLRREAESLPKTIGGALTDLRNTLLLTIGQINEATGASSEFAQSLLSIGKPAIRVVFQTLSVLGANVAFVFKTIGREIGAYAAQIAAMLRLDFKGARFIGDAVKEESRVARAELDALEKRVLAVGKTQQQAAATPGSSARNGARVAIPAKTKPDRSAISAARQEAAALIKAQEDLEKARLDAAAQGLEDGIITRREKLEQARAAELIDAAGFIAAKAALDEEGLRNELAALQAQQAKLRDASTAAGSKASDRTQALAELVLVEARIESASQKILNLNQSATAELTALGVAKLRAQSEFIDGLEQEAFLSGLNNDERETALVLLEAEKLGITDVNRLLELQGQIRANANAKTAAEETKRQQDDLYKSVQDGVQRAFADGLNAIATGEGGIRGALKNIADTIRNAMSNALAGSLADGFLGLLGGKEGVLNIAGSLGFGGKKDGSSAASALYVRDVSAGGIAGAGTGEAGGLFSGLGETLSGLFNSIKSALSGLVSSIGNALSSLFSSSGGGGGSSAGSWISAIASIFGYAEGGFTGPGSKYQPAGVVHAGEYVFSADSVRRLGLGALDNLHRLAKGSVVPSMPRFGYAEGGAVNLPGAAAPVVNTSTRIVNVFDMDSAMSNYLQTRSGERAILNIIQRNPGATGG